MHVTVTQRLLLTIRSGRVKTKFIAPEISTMYLLEAKKRAEKEFKEQQKKEKEEARAKARKERYAQKEQAKADKVEKRAPARGVMVVLILVANVSIHGIVCE